MLRKTQFANDHYYHIYNRGVDKRKIFLENKHYYRFIQGLYEFNDLDVVTNVNWRLFNYGSPAPIVKKRKRLVEIICFCLMPSHFHLILKQLVENGISKFMHKLGTGYANYFNEVQDRTGSLFEGRYKSILIEEDRYFVHLSRYIHLNCIGLIEPKWKECGIKDWEKVNKFLERYRWSSYLDYVEKSNMPSLVNTDFILNYFGSKEKYRQFTSGWLHDDINYIKDLTLE
ncbi:MAG: transposase [Candidatus Omnitrophica bacterium]|nr:transposase [Candidatus Omnitrophota bacterium]